MFTAEVATEAGRLPESWRHLDIQISLNSAELLIGQVISRDNKYEMLNIGGTLLDVFAADHKGEIKINKDMIQCRKH